MINDKHEFIAFGQFYLRLGHCHLGRLVVNPQHRGQGIINQLIQQLAIKGTKTLGNTSLSLFVLTTNPSAINAYKRLGFNEFIYPESLPLENCIYMTLEQPHWLND